MSRRFLDLHTHSTASDGSLEPADLIAAADRAELAAVALTDHDTTAGLPEAQSAATQYPQLTLVPGVEVSALSHVGPMHILGLGIDETSQPLVAMLREVRRARAERNPRILQKLAELGIELNWSDVLALAGGRSDAIVSRAHIAEALRRAGVVRSVKEAFEKYVGIGGQAYVEKDRLAPGEVIRTLRDADGLVALAHPGLLEIRNRAQLHETLRMLKHKGLEAVEVYHSDHDARTTRVLLDLAGELSLMVVGGSDFHGHAKPQVALGRPRFSMGAAGNALLERLGIPA
ncbi:MAG: PHP domain-containing protein [Planctomycetota bacterium]